MISVRPFHIESIAPPTELENFKWPHVWRESSALAQSPLDLEIGCGVGWHPITYATSHPERRLIAIEHTRAKFESFATRLRRHEPILNLLPIHADAIRWVTHAVAPSSLSRCLFLYPNPEPKAPNKRWFRSSFMQRLIETLKPGGEILLATNEEWYFDEALTYSKQFWGLEIVETRSFKQDNAPSETPRTHFEKKYLLRGETCFDLRVRKNEESVTK